LQALKLFGGDSLRQSGSAFNTEIYHPLRTPDVKPLDHWQLDNCTTSLWYYQISAHVKCKYSYRTSN